VKIKENGMIKWGLALNIICSLLNKGKGVAELETLAIEDELGIFLLLHLLKHIFKIKTPFLNAPPPGAFKKALDEYRLGAIML